MDYTRKFSIQNEKDPEIKEILSCVYSSLQEKGYNP
ncbi:MAG: IreB family regulatory phosphoprotein, partial [Lawsonibacter sp.]